VSTDKKSACDSKLIVDHSNQKTQQHKDYAAGAGDLVVQLQRSYNNNSTTSAVNVTATGNGRPDTPNNQLQTSSQQATPQERVSSPSPQPTMMEESVEQ
jgi:hypothetical protein